MENDLTDSRRLLVLAIDAASPDLLRSWARDGTLPNIAGLMSRGLVGDTRSVEAMYVGSTWPSFYTAVNPAGHGFYWLDRPRSGTYRTFRSTAADLGRRKAVWEVLSDAGRRVIVLDVPLSRKSPGLNGQQVVEWRVHDPFFGLQTTPPELKHQIARIAGQHPAPANCDAVERTLADCRTFADQLVQGAGLRSQLTRQLLAAGNWDFGIQVFSEAHCAGHQLWHLHDSRHPGYDPDAARRQGDLVRDVYVAIDTAIGEILSGLDSQTTVVLVSLHGMSYMAGAGALLEQILVRLGVMQLANGPSRDDSRVLDAGAGNRFKAAYRRLPSRLRMPIYELRRSIGTRWLKRGSLMNFDPRGSKCFHVDLGTSCSGIRLNIKGREPHGILAPGAEAEQFADQLIERLLEITDPRTGRRLVERACRVRELFSGPRLDDLPDLVIEWDQEQPVGTTMAGAGGGATLQGYSERVGLVEHLNNYCRTGDHRIEGMFVASGPGIVPGHLGRVVSNLDLAPSFARFLGCEMAGVDGTPIPELSGR